MLKSVERLDEVKKFKIVSKRRESRCYFFFLFWSWCTLDFQVSSTRKTWWNRSSVAMPLQPSDPIDFQWIFSFCYLEYLLFHLFSRDLLPRTSTFSIFHSRFSPTTFLDFVNQFNKCVIIDSSTAFTFSWETFYSIEYSTQDSAHWKTKPRVKLHLESWPRIIK